MFLGAVSKGLMTGWFCKLGGRRGSKGFIFWVQGAEAIAEGKILLVGLWTKWLGAHQ